MDNEPVVIIGGGIGGLTLANALQRCDIPFELYEQAPELTEIGAGIGLSESPITILEKLGLGDSLRRQSVRIKNVFMPDKNLNIRRKIRPSSEIICIHRARLIDILKSGIPEQHVHLSKRVTGIETSKKKTTIIFDDGEKITRGPVVAADGIHSVIRKELFPEIQIRYINQTVWRGITETPLPEEFNKSFIEIWDEGLRFLAIQIDSKQIFWLGVQPVLPGGTDNPETLKKDLIQLFGNFHSDLRELIATSKNIIRNDMADLGTTKRDWFKNKIVFLGDAIHATTPNLAQGGCQAIEDAYCLALCLKKYEYNLQAAYSNYYRLRHKKVMKIVADSWKFGRAAHSKNPLFHYGFRSILTHAPEFVLRNQENFLNDLGYLQELS